MHGGGIMHTYIGVRKKEEEEEYNAQIGIHDTNFSSLFFICFLLYQTHPPPKYIGAKFYR